MSQVEAAASLSGSSDSGSDFFSVSEGEHSASNSAAGTSSADDFYSTSSQAASNLFVSENEQSGASSLFQVDGQESGFAEEHTSEGQYGAYPSGDHEGYEQPLTEGVPYSHAADTHDSLSADIYSDNPGDSYYVHSSDEQAAYGTWQTHDEQYQGGNEGGC